jgi:hypothetical protein
MTSSNRGTTAPRRAASLGIALALAASVCTQLPPAQAEPLRIGGTVGFGITAVRAPGAFRWDDDSAHEDTLLAVLKLGAEMPHLNGFVALGARLGDVTSPDTEFELREAALVAAWRSAASDSAGLRLFARQPGSLWVEGAFEPAIATATAGAADALGARADAAWRRATATLLVTDRGGLGPRLDPVVAAPPLPPATGDALVLRLGMLAVPRAQLRLGATWKRLQPGDVALGAGDRNHRDVLGADVRAGWHGVTATVAYSQSTDEFATDPVAPPAAVPHGWRSEWNGRLTDVLPSNASLRAELRAPDVALGRWGRVGFAPQYRALGSTFVDRLVDAEPDAGAPRRGLEGYRLEAWYTVPSWPVWLRQVYDRHQQFRDADRRVILQSTEAQAWLAEGIRGRLAYVQRDERLPSTGRREHHDDLIGEIVAEDGRARARMQAGIVDLDAAHERSVLALESAARIGTHVQALARLAVASEGGRARRGFWVEMQLWHLPQFELAVQYGPEWIGDGSDPALDNDLTADGDDVDRIRLHFQGWF